MLRERFNRLARAFFFACLLSACGSFSSSDSPILSRYQDIWGANLLMRRAPHAGVDFEAPRGSPVLASADGKVTSIVDSNYGCGKGVLLLHSRFGRYTLYCHLSKISVSLGQDVTRGETIGLVGISGRAVGVPHVHQELCTVSCPHAHVDGDLKDTEDPLKISDGCYDPNKKYPEDRLVLTYPIQCTTPETTAAK